MQHQGQCHASLIPTRWFRHGLRLWYMNGPCSNVGLPAHVFSSLTQKLEADRQSGSNNCGQAPLAVSRASLAKQSVSYATLCNEIILSVIEVGSRRSQEAFSDAQKLFMHMPTARLVLRAQNTLESLFTEPILCMHV